MGLFGLLKKKSEKDIQGLEIYSGMQVIVKALDGKMLFIAKLQNPQGNTADPPPSPSMHIQSYMHGRLPSPSPDKN